MNGMTHSTRREHNEYQHYAAIPPNFHSFTCRKSSVMWNRQVLRYLGVFAMKPTTQELIDSLTYIKAQIRHLRTIEYVLTQYNPPLNSPPPTPTPAKESERNGAERSPPPPSIKKNKLNPNAEWSGVEPRERMRKYGGDVRRQNK
jgi:hypothetical protein